MGASVVCTDLSKENDKTFEDRNALLEFDEFNKGSSKFCIEIWSFLQCNG